jgi:hypothetical protein
MADVEPGGAEYPFHFKLEERRIGIELSVYTSGLDELGKIPGPHIQPHRRGLLAVSTHIMRNAILTARGRNSKRSASMSRRPNP